MAENNIIKKKKEVVHLGASSFVYMLNSLGKDFYFPSKTQIMLIFPDKEPFPVEIRDKNKTPPHCGYIVIDAITLNNLYGNDTDSIRNFSERKTGGLGIEHCTVRNDPGKYGNTLIVVKGESLICYYSPAVSS